MTYFGGLRSRCISGFGFIACMYSTPRAVCSNQLTAWAAVYGGNGGLPWRTVNKQQKLPWIRIILLHVQHSLRINTTSLMTCMTSTQTRVSIECSQTCNIHIVAGCGCTRDQCVTVAQLHTSSHSPLLAAYLHCIGRPDSATCPHCNGAEETAEHLNQGS